MTQWYSIICINTVCFSRSHRSWTMLAEWCLLGYLLSLLIASICCHKRKVLRRTARMMSGGKRLKNNRNKTKRGLWLQTVRVHRSTLGHTDALSLHGWTLSLRVHAASTFVVHVFDTFPCFGCMVEVARGLQKSWRLVLLFVSASLRICEFVFVNTKMVDIWIIEPFACRTLIVPKGEANCVHDVLKLQIVALNSLPYQVLCNGTLIDPHTCLSALPNKMNGIANHVKSIAGSWPIRKRFNRFRPFTALDWQWKTPAMQ